MTTLQIQNVLKMHKLLSKLVSSSKQVEVTDNKKDTCLLCCGVIAIFMVI
jgi:hypothetical protein